MYRYFLPEASGAEIMHTSQYFYSYGEHRNVPRGGNRPAFRNALASCKTLETSTAHGERLIRRNAVYSRSNRALFSFLITTATLRSRATAA